MQEIMAMMDGLHLCGLAGMESERIELNARDDNGGTAFMLACYKGHKDVVKLLLDYPDLRIDLNAKVPATSTDEASQVPCRTM